jgi:transposase
LVKNSSLSELPQFYGSEFGTVQAIKLFTANSAMKLSLDKVEQEALRQLSVNHRYPEVRKRGMALLMLAAGEALATIQQQLGVSHQSVYNWHSNWENGGIEGLLNVKRQGGRPEKLPVTWVKKALELASTGPYTARQIAHSLEEQFGQSLPCSLRTFTRVLKDGGMSYKRTRLSLKKKRPKAI